MTTEFLFLSAAELYRVYQSTWQPITGEVLQVDREVVGLFLVLASEICHATSACAT